MDSPIISQTYDPDETFVPGEKRQPQAIELLKGMSSEQNVYMSGKDANSWWSQKALPLPFSKTYLVILD